MDSFIMKHSSAFSNTYKSDYFLEEENISEKHQKPTAFCHRLLDKVGASTWRQIRQLKTLNTNSRAVLFGPRSVAVTEVSEKFIQGYANIFALSRHQRPYAGKERGYEKQFSSKGRSAFAMCVEREWGRRVEPSDSQVEKTLFIQSCNWFWLPRDT